MKKIFLLVLAGLGGALLTFILFVTVLVDSVIPKQYSTTNISDYGRYTGNNTNKFAQEFIPSFFPEQIEPYFSDVQYSYRAQKNDAYAFEAYLEFTLPDDKTYNAFVAKHTAGMDCTKFLYAPEYTEYSIANTFALVIRENNSADTGSASIGDARIGKILCKPNERRVIFVAIGVYDGGIVETDFLSVFFNRFQINPREYARTADSRYQGER